MTLFRLRGVPVRLHWTLIALLVGWVGWRFVDGGTPAALQGAVEMAVIFGSILLHELGHALVAQRWGLRVLSVTLLAVGGAAQVSWRERPWEEGEPDPSGEVDPYVRLQVALGGPLTNLLVAAVAGVGAWVTGWGGLTLITGVNLILGLFNLVPAYPMDGGRVFRAWLAEVLRDDARAVRVALWLGVGFATVLGASGVWWGDPGLVLVAVLLGLLQAQELQARGLWRARV